MLKRNTWILTILTALGLFVAACAQAPAATTDQSAAEPGAVPPAIEAPDSKTVTNEDVDEIAGEDVEEQTTTEVQGLVWVANGMEDSLSAIDPSNSQVVTTVPVGVNPHILDSSPDGRIIYVINAGGHDRQPGAHDEELPMEEAAGEMGQDVASAAHQGDMAMGSSDKKIEPQSQAAGHGTDMEMGMEEEAKGILSTVIKEHLHRSSM
jgi:YVTN family beta-propeller protein